MRGARGRDAQRYSRLNSTLLLFPRPRSATEWSGFLISSNGSSVQGFRSATRPRILVKSENRQERQAAKNSRVEVVAEHSKREVPTVNQSSSVKDLVVLLQLLLIAKVVPYLALARVLPALALVDLKELVPEDGSKYESAWVQDKTDAM